MELRKFIATTIREYLNEQYTFNNNSVRNLIDSLKNELPIKITPTFTLTNGFIQSIAPKIGFEYDVLYNWINVFINLHNKGGVVYRVITIEDGMEVNLNPESIGNHWTNKEGITYIINNLGKYGIDFNGDNIYVITAYTPPKNVSIEHVDFVSWTKEQEYNIIDKSKIKIKNVKKIKQK